MHLASWVLVGGAAGILAGVLFGDDCAILSPIGLAYIGLLQAAVYPYLVCSLLHGLGGTGLNRRHQDFQSRRSIQMSARRLSL